MKSKMSSAKRSRMKKEVTIALEGLYLKNDFPKREVLVRFADQHGQKEFNVQMWFSRRRAKDRIRFKSGAREEVPQLASAIPLQTSNMETAKPWRRKSQDIVGRSVLFELEDFFSKENHPSFEHIATLSRKLDEKPKVISKWFARRRMKAKKEYVKNLDMETYVPPPHIPPETTFELLKSSEYSEGLTPDVATSTDNDTPLDLSKPRVSQDLLNMCTLPAIPDADAPPLKLLLSKLNDPPQCGSNESSSSSPCLLPPSEFDNSHSSTSSPHLSSGHLTRLASPIRVPVSKFPIAAPVAQFSGNQAQDHSVSQHNKSHLVNEIGTKVIPMPVAVPKLQDPRVGAVAPSFDKLRKAGSAFQFTTKTPLVNEARPTEFIPMPTFFSQPEVHFRPDDFQPRTIIRPTPRVPVLDSPTFTERSLGQPGQPTANSRQPPLPTFTSSITKHPEHQIHPSVIQKRPYPHTSGQTTPTFRTSTDKMSFRCHQSPILPKTNEDHKCVLGRFSAEDSILGRFYKNVASTSSALNSKSQQTLMFPQIKRELNSEDMTFKKQCQTPTDKLSVKFHKPLLPQFEQVQLSSKSCNQQVPTTSAPTKMSEQVGFRALKPGVTNTLEGVQNVTPTPDKLPKLLPMQWLYPNVRFGFPSHIPSVPSYPCRCHISPWGHRQCPLLGNTVCHPMQSPWRP